MERLLSRLSDLAGRRRRLVIAVWALLFALAGPFSGKVADVLSNGGFEVPGSQSLNVIHALDAAGGHGAQPFTLLVDAPTSAEARARLAAVRSQVAARFPQLHAVAPPQASRDGRAIALFTVASVTQSESLKLAHDIAGAVQQADGRVRTFVLGPGATYDTFQRVSQDGILQAEIIGLPVALAVLLLLFGTLVAGVLPLVLGAAAVTISLGLLYWIARLTEVSVFAQQMTTMIGLGVAIDYSLFIVARFREELAGGRERADAVRTAMRTSGTAVVFSGITVIVSLGTVWIVPVRAVQSMAAGAMLVVAVAVVAAATLLPALLHVVGGRIDSLPLRRRRAPATPGGSSFWQRFARAVMARPVVSFVASAGLLAVLALPAFSLVTANTSLAQLPRGEAVVRGNDVLVRQITGPGQGREGALTVLVRPGRFGPAPAAAGAERLAAKLLADPRVAATHVERVGDGYEVVAPLRIDPEGAAAVNGLVPDVRALVDALRLEPAARVDVGGLSAFQRDLNEEVGGDLWLLIVALLVLAYLVLLVMLRSLLLPLKAVIMNLLSIGAAYGVIVAVFQWGWLDFTGFHHLGYVSTLTPPLVLAITFGLSMDYEVFLLSRIRERYVATGDTARAVAEGLAGSARVITSAALIMVVVFGSFVLTGVPAIKEIGLGLAVAIAIDATITRLVLVPATMRLLGGWNWWLPGWLDRALPHVAGEGAEPAGR